MIIPKRAVISFLAEPAVCIIGAEAMIETRLARTMARIVYQAYSDVVTDPKSLNMIVRDRGVEPGEPADPGQAERNEHHRKDDDEEPLDDVGQGRGDEAAHHRIDADDDGEDDVDDERVRVRNERPELAFLVPVVEFVVAGFLARRSSRRRVLFQAPGIPGTSPRSGVRRPCTLRAASGVRAWTVLPATM